MFETKHTRLVVFYVIRVCGAARKSLSRCAVAYLKIYRIGTDFHVGFIGIWSILQLTMKFLVL